MSDEEQREKALETLKGRGIEGVNADHFVDSPQIVTKMIELPPEMTTAIPALIEKLTAYAILAGPVRLALSIPHDLCDRLESECLEVAAQAGIELRFAAGTDLTQPAPFSSSPVKKGLVH